MYNININNTQEEFKMKKTVNALGDTCPIPLVKAKEAIKELQGAGTVEVLVDNEIAVQNLTKMANQKGYGCVSKKLKEQEYQVTLTIGEAEATEETKVEKENYAACAPAKKNRLVVISSKTMGEGNDELGATLLKGFIYALTQQDELPDQMLFYNGGAFLTCEGSQLLEDLKMLEEQGVEIRTCGTCLNFYGLSDKLQVGEVTNMYDIAERMTKADLIVKP